MTVCSRPGCDRPARVRLMCKSHYGVQRKYSHNLARWARKDSIGITRRIRALVAIGYSQSHLAELLDSDVSWVSKLAHNDRPRVNADTVARVTALYDKISMTPGPSQAAKDRAHRKGWMPPLAWDDDTIDLPEAKPNPGHQEKLGFTERYTELRELGYDDFEILRRWKMQPESLLRQLNRYDIEPSPGLVNLATTTRRQRTRAS